MPRRFLFLLLSAFSLFFSSGAPEEGVTLPILMYHDVSDAHPGKDVVTPAELRSDLIWLKEEGYHPVTMARVIAYADGGAALPEKPIVLSFDDGLTSACDRVLPLLRELDMPIVLSVIAGSADEFTAYRQGKVRLAHAAWPQLRELAESGLVAVIVVIDSRENKIISRPSIVSRGFVHVNNSQDLIKDAKALVYEALKEKMAQKTTFGELKNTIRSSLEPFLYQKTHRSPIVIPVILNHVNANQQNTNR